MAIDHRSDRSVYQQIADELRQRISSGQYEPGSKLPSETELVEEYDVTRITVRRALAVLAGEGLTESQRGRGVFVREVPPVMRLGNNRFSREARRRGLGAFAAEAERLGLEWEQEDLELATVEAPPAIAEVLGESRAVVKRRRMILADRPTQLADSYVPESIAVAIGYDKGATAPGGIYGLLEQHGHLITRFRETIRLRSATPDEAVALDLPPAAPVALLTRIAFDQAERAVEYFDSVAAGDKHVYVYEFDAPNE
jgi:GntR family transcriptional regulator